MFAIPLGAAIYIDNLQLSFQENPGILNPEKSWKQKKNVEKIQAFKEQSSCSLHTIKEVVHNFGKSDDHII